MASDEPSELVVEFSSLRRSDSLKNLESWSISSAFNVPADVFDFDLYDDLHPERLLGLELEPVTLKLGETTQLIGRIESTTMDGAAVRCEGRDYIGDLVECGCDPSIVIKEGEDLSLVVLEVTGPAGITAVFEEEADHIAARAGFVPPGWQAVSKPKKTKKQGDLKPNPGQGMIDFLNPICARNACTLQTTPSRSALALVSPHYGQGPIGEIVCTREGGGNVERAAARRDFSKFPTYTIAYGHQARVGERSEKAFSQYDIVSFAESISAQGSSEIADAMRDRVVGDRIKPSDAGVESPFGQLYRLLVIKDDVARDQAQVDNSVLRAISGRLKDTLTYTVTLRGHRSSSGAVWSVNTIVDVKDAVRNVNEHLWVMARRLSFNRQGGATAELTCIRPGSYMIGADA